MTACSDRDILMSWVLMLYSSEYCFASLFDACSLASYCADNYDKIATMLNMPGLLNCLYTR